MSRRAWVGLAVVSSLLLTSCAANDELVVRSPGLASAGTVVIRPRPGRRPVQVSELAYLAALGPLLRDLRQPIDLSGVFSSRQPKARFRLVVSEVDVAGDQLGQGYQRWCQERYGFFGDCLQVQHGRPGLDADGRYKVAFDIALGQRWDGFETELAAMADPQTVRTLLLGAMVTYLALLAIPEPFSKVAAVVATMVLTAYLGAEALWNLVGGWLQMVRRADVARTFKELKQAGDDYGKLMGAQTGRTLVMVVMTALTEGGAAAHFEKLPGAVAAAAAFATDTDGQLSLEAAWRSPSATVAANGNISLELAPSVAAAGQGARVVAVAMSPARGPGRLQSGKGQPVPGKKGPGDWRKAKSPARGRAGKYQQQVTGRPPEDVYIVNEVEFDDYDVETGELVHVEDMDGVLVDAKGPGYQKFFEENLKPKEWFEKTGAKKLIGQAKRQLDAAKPTGTRVRWYVAEEHAANAIRKLFERAAELKDSAKIEVVYRPMR